MVPIIIDKARNFKYNMRSLDRIEKALRKNMGSIDFDNMTITETMVVIWAGLAHEDPKLTPDNLLDLIDESGVKISIIVEAMTEAMKEAYGTPEKQDNKMDPSQAIVE